MGTKQRPEGQVVVVEEHRVDLRVLRQQPIQQLRTKPNGRQLRRQQLQSWLIATGLTHGLTVAFGALQGPRVELRRGEVPEVILNKGHTFSVDWWCIGILAYECLGCQTPFLSDSDMAMYRKIVKGPADGNISWPKSIPPDARDFIEAQINVDPLKRPGSMKDGALDVKTHKWLAQVDWKKAEARKLEAPWKPKIKSATDASNFDEFDDDAKENFPREDFAKDLFKEFADVWV